MLQSETTENVGLSRRRFDMAWLYWGAQALVLFTYAIYSYSSYLPKSIIPNRPDVIDDGK